MSLAKCAILRHIRSNSAKVQFLKYSKFCLKNPDIFQICHDGIILHNYVYCNKCAQVLYHVRRSTIDFYQHCRCNKNSVSDVKHNSHVRKYKVSKNQMGEKEETPSKQENLFLIDDDIMERIYKVRRMSFSKEELHELILSRSERITFVKEIKICLMDPDLFQIRLDGFLSPKYVYCLKCDALMKQHIGSTSNLNIHCKSLKHLQKQCHLSNIGFSISINDDSPFHCHHCQEEGILCGNWF